MQDVMFTTMSEILSIDSDECPQRSSSRFESPAIILRLSNSSGGKDRLSLT